jgi:hypothetical protein
MNINNRNSYNTSSSYGYNMRNNRYGNLNMMKRKINDDKDKNRENSKLMKFGKFSKNNSTKMNNINNINNNEHPSLYNLHDPYPYS